MIDIESVLSKLNEPASFRSSAVFAKDGKDALRFSVQNMGSSRGLTATLLINDGTSGKYVSDRLQSMDEAKDELAAMYNKWIQYKGRFKGRKLSDSDMSDLMYT